MFFKTKNYTEDRWIEINKNWKKKNHGISLNEQSLFKVCTWEYKQINKFYDKVELKTWRQKM